MTGLWRRVREVFRVRQLDREAAEELAHHVETLVDQKIQAGMDEAGARRQARLEVGSIDAARELLAEGRTGFAFEQVVRELTYAARVLRRAPGITLLSIATMGAGIGASTILFALVNGVVLRPLPFPDSQRLVRIFDSNPQAGIERVGAASGNINDWRSRAAASFEGISGFYATGRTLSGDAEAEVLITAQVSADFFPMLAVAPLLGHWFSEEETRRAQFSGSAAPVGADPVVILSHRVWQQRYGGDDTIIGRTIMLERRAFRIVGVMPAGFLMPDAGVQLWMPWDLSGDRPRDQHYLSAIGRVKPGITLQQAEDHLNAVANELGVEHPATNRGWSVRLSPLVKDMVGGTASILWVLFAAVGLVLLVVCANVALLSLLRGMDRQDETSVRLALGASPRRLLREFLLESVLLAGAGGGLGAIVAVGGIRLLPRLATDIPRLNEVTLDAGALSFMAILTTLAALVSGIPQAWRRTRVAPLDGLLAGSRRSTASGRRHLLRDAIVVGQVAMAVVLMVGSGLLVRSFLHLRDVDPGFDASGVLVAPVFLDSQAYTSGERVRAYYSVLFDRLSAIPGVTAVGGATTVPTSLLGPAGDRPLWPEGTGPDDARRTSATVRMVTPGYFPALRLRIADGRAFEERDGPDAPRVIMINETLARRLYGPEPAVGKNLVVDYSTNGTYPYEIVGVVGDIRFRGPRSEPVAEIYLPHAQRSYLIMHVVLRTEGEPGALMPMVRAALKEIDPQKPAHGLYPLEELVGATYARDRQAMVTLMVFAASAIFLAVLGVYGVLAQRVRERSREIGIRIAMGASVTRVAGWIAGAGLRLIATGIGAGLVIAWSVGGALGGLLYGVKPADAVTTTAVVVLLIVVGLAATLIPALRASRIDPVVILRRG